MCRTMKQLRASDVSPFEVDSFPANLAGLQSENAGHRPSSLVRQGQHNQERGQHLWSESRKEPVNCRCKLQSSIDEELGEPVFVFYIRPDHEQERREYNKLVGSWIQI